MRTICAWCTLVIAEGTGVEDEAVSHGICSTCAGSVLSKDALAALTKHMLEMIRMQGLLLEMVGDLYEVAQSLAPKAGMGMQPAPAVKAWQQQRG